MTRWALVADLNRCVGCQTCTAACKHANATAPGIQWRKVLDIEAGEYPDVRRAFVPVGCMHCEDPPCLDVCPTTATRKRDDGIVTIDYDLCIGCAYCAVACPYQARSRVDAPASAYGNGQMRHEAAREDPARIGVAQKCTFCMDRIDQGLAMGLQPGADPEATPACVASCIAGALHFGDIDDRGSNVNQLLAEHRHFRMHDELGTEPGVYYLWSRTADTEDPLMPPEMLAKPATMSAAGPLLQKNWDWRAAANFILGGAGGGLLAAAAGLATGGSPVTLPVLLALALVALGLLCVWFEIGRPWRFANVCLHARRSWMSREAFVALPLFVCGLAAAVSNALPWALAAGVCGLLFLYCQARILQSAKGIPAWRHSYVTGLVVMTGLAEGSALLAALMALTGAAVQTLQMAALLCLLFTGLRLAAWQLYRGGLGAIGAPAGTFEAFENMALRLDLAHQVVPMVLLAAGFLLTPFFPALLLVASALIVASGWWFKYTLIVRAAFNQGYSLERMPARGAGTAARGIKPGWVIS